MNFHFVFLVVILLINNSLQAIIEIDQPYFTFQLPMTIYFGISNSDVKYYRKNKQPSTPYDSIWFEGQATKLGKKYLRRS